MFPTPELANLLHEERTRSLSTSRLERIAACARACSAAPGNLLDRIVRFGRPAADVC